MKKLTFPALAFAVIGTSALSLTAQAADFLEGSATLNVQAVLEQAVEIKNVQDSVTLDIEGSRNSEGWISEEISFTVNRRGINEQNPFGNYSLLVDSDAGSDYDQFLLSNGEETLGMVLHVRDSHHTTGTLMPGQPLSLETDGNMANDSRNTTLSLSIMPDHVDAASAGTYQATLTMTVAAE